MRIKQNDVVIIVRPSDESDTGFEIIQSIISPFTKDKEVMFEIAMVALMMTSFFEFLADREELTEEFQEFMYETHGDQINAVKERLDKDEPPDDSQVSIEVTLH